MVLTLPTIGVFYLPLLLIVWVPILFYYWALYKNTYWKRHAIANIPAHLFFGNLKEPMTYRKSIADHFVDLYHNRIGDGKPYVGIHIFHKPTLLVKDPDLIKKILVKDFSSFMNRHSSGYSDSLGANNLFFLRDKPWKHLRARLTPIFTSGKMKQMYGLLYQIGIELDRKISLMDLQKNTEVEVKDLCARFTTDVIGSCIFGLDANSLENPNSEFRESGRKMFAFNWYRSIEFSSFFFLPEIVPLFRFKVFSKDASQFLRKSINYVINEREKNGVIRNDLIDALVNLKREDENKIKSDSEILFRDDNLVAQAAIFFIAGFESSSSLMSFALFEMSWQDTIQKKLRQEIKETLIKHKNADISYDTIQNMEYLNMVVSETLRMYPPLPFLDRLCTTRKGLPLDMEDKFTIPYGMPIIIPIFALQRDPKYFPNPNHFDPERFASENRHHINPYVYMPFGTGPHNCIGERFGLVQAKVGLVQFFKNHRVAPCHKTPRTMKLEKKALIVQPEGGITLKIIRDPLIETK